MTSRRWFAVLLGLLLATDIYFAAKLPVTSAEGAVYTRYITRPLSEQFFAPFDLHIGLPYALLARFTKWIFGVSELSLRLPAVFGGALFAWVLLQWGWRWGLLSLLVIANPWNYQAFCTAGGRGLGLGLLFFALWRARWHLPTAGMLLGLAVASDPLLAGAAVAAGFVVVLVTRKGAWLVVDEFMVPAVLVATLLLSPFLLTRAKPAPAAFGDRGTRDLIRRIPREKPVTLGSSISLEPGVDFYRRRFHMSWISSGGASGPDRDFDYFLLGKEDRALTQKRGLKVLATAGDEVLAGR